MDSDASRCGGRLLATPFRFPDSCGGTGPGRDAGAYFFARSQVRPRLLSPVYVQEGPFAGRPCLGAESIADLIADKLGGKVGRGGTAQKATPDMTTREGRRHHHRGGGHYCPQPLAHSFAVKWAPR